MLGLLSAVFVIFALVAGGSLRIIDLSMRRMVVGILSCVSLISMFASPLFIIVSFLKTVSIHTHISYNGTVCIITSYFFVFNLTFVPQNLVIRTKSVEYMPFYLSLSTFLMSTAFFLYGIFNFDPFVYVSFLCHIKLCFYL